MMRIAIVGAGISGLVCAHLLARRHHVTVYERESWIGGHTHTVDLHHEGRDLRVDTGFIVFNRVNYPSFCRLIDSLGVQEQDAPMSFSYRDDASGFEYGGATLGSLFAQRRNFLRPRMYRMLLGIRRLGREAGAYIHGAEPEMNLGEYLDKRRYPREFIAQYIAPMCAAIWSAPRGGALALPARFVLRFFEHHGMLRPWQRPQWKVIRGGSDQYVQRLIEPIRPHIRSGTRVQSVERDADGVTITVDGRAERHDQVILAVHADQAAEMLAHPTPAEREVLAAMPYQSNDVVLHTDATILPRRPKAWSAWNYYEPKSVTGQAGVIATYNMTILQSLGTRAPVCVTLNHAKSLDASRIAQRFVYHHPRYTAVGMLARRRHMDISGSAPSPTRPGRTHFCGAYWGNGFHEDGVNSALAVCAEFGETL